jgi:microcystin-dependent protein
MSGPYVGEIRIFAGNFAPVGWAFCNGQTVPISENEVLFQLIGTTYGGDGIQTFNLPNLQSRVPVHVGPGFALGQAAGSEDVTLGTAQIPAHSHTVLATTNSNTASQPGGNFLAQGPDIYETNIPGNAQMSPTLTPAGGSQPHSNLQPYLCVSFIISLYGVFPSQS